MLNPIKVFLRRKQWAYRTLFKTDDDQLNEAAKIVLADLRTFCGGTKSPFHPDPATMGKNCGRQEVWQRLMNWLEIDYADTYRLEEDFEE